VPRPREFDHEDVLVRALGLFWLRGYDGTSITDLVNSTGVQRQSLYNVFVDKAGIFRAALALYIARVTESLAPLDDPAAGLPAIRRYMEGVLDVQRDFGACILVKTAFGPAIVDPDVRTAVETGADLVRTKLRAVIARAQQRGQVADGVSPPAAAAYLYVVLNGLAALVATGGDKKHVTTTIDHAIASLT
jgi:TetR/AcrR family transcriptional regulator, transcriptional repressor for nem operon